MASYSVISLRGEGLGESQFRQLEKMLSTLLLCDGNIGLASVICDSHVNKHHAVRNRLFAVCLAHHKSSSRGSFYGFQHSMNIVHLYRDLLALHYYTDYSRFWQLCASSHCATCPFKSIYSKSCLPVRLMMYVLGKKHIIPVWE